MKAKKNAAGKDEITLAKTGIVGLDKVLPGGLTAGTLCLVEGAAGTGKTTLGLQFALEGVREGESVLYVTLSETQSDLERVARSHGWDLENVHIMQASALPETPTSIFHPSEVELGELMTRVKEQIKQLGPARIVIDSLTEIRLMAEGTLRYRREIMGLRQSLASWRCTILLLEGGTPESNLRTFADGVILLEQLAVDYGAQRRRLWIAKARGREFVGGFHDFLIRKGGMEVFPRLATAPPCPSRKPEVLASGIASLDALLGGGVTLGQSTLIVGPAGVGKSSVAMQFAISAAEHGGYAALFLFDERPETIIAQGHGAAYECPAASRRGVPSPPASGPGGTFGRPVRSHSPPRGPIGQAVCPGYRQSQRIPAGPARSAVPARPDARDPGLPGPMRRRHVPGHGTGRHGGRDVLTGPRQLPDG